MTQTKGRLGVSEKAMVVLVLYGPSSESEYALAVYMFRRAEEDEGFPMLFQEHHLCDLAKCFKLGLDCIRVNHVWETLDIQGFSLCSDVPLRNQL